MAETDRIQLLQGTLHLLVLQTLLFGPRHGHGIATAIERSSEDVLLVDHSSLGSSAAGTGGLVASEWGVSENKRRAEPDYFAQ